MPKLFSTLVVMSFGLTLLVFASTLRAETTAPDELVRRLATTLRVNEGVAASLLSSYLKNALDPVHARDTSSAIEQVTRSWGTQYRNALTHSALAPQSRVRTFVSTADHGPLFVRLSRVPGYIIESEHVPDASHIQAIYGLM